MQMPEIPRIKTYIEGFDEKLNREKNVVLIGGSAILSNMEGLGLEYSNVEKKLSVMDFAMLENSVLQVSQVLSENT